MRAAAILIGGAALLAACSGEPAAPGADNQASAPPAADASGLSGNVSGETGAVAGPAGMRADVSALTGDVSGLNTRVTDMGTIIDLPSDALFDYDKADLTPAAETELRKAAEMIRMAPPGPIAVIGHTDSNGDDAYNQRLSEARAKTVADWFGQQAGVRQRPFTTSGKGETAPIAPNAGPDGRDDPAGRAKNRRVEVVMPNAGAPAE